MFFAWGDNSSGKLGDGTNINRLTPVDITSQFGFIGSESIKGMSLATDFTVAYTSNNRVFSWGSNINSNMGFEHINGDPSSYYDPVEITSQFSLNPLESFKSVKSYSTSTLMLTDQNRIFSFGENGNGILGMDR